MITHLGGSLQLAHFIITFVGIFRSWHIVGSWQSSIFNAQWLLLLLFTVVFAATMARLCSLGTAHDLSRINENNFKFLCTKMLQINPPPYHSFGLAVLDLFRFRWVQSQGE